MTTINAKTREQTIRDQLRITVYREDGSPLHYEYNEMDSVKKLVVLFEKTGFRINPASRDDAVMSFFYYLESLTTDLYGLYQTIAHFRFYLEDKDFSDSDFAIRKNLITIMCSVFSDYELRAFEARVDRTLSERGQMAENGDESPSLPVYAPRDEAPPPYSE